ncbi:MAG: dienelactone hydrolase family protein [Erysipelotrichaceae bacterium]|nr:dienelactone hydrolase family protein [Erysipelotrichaceae bacterium]
MRAVLRLGGPDRKVGGLERGFPVLTPFPLDREREFQVRPDRISAFIGQRLHSFGNHLREQPNSNEKVGVIGMCSGGRHTFMAACSLTGIDAAVDCWGGGVIMSPEQLSPARPVSPIDNAKDLKCPLLGIFGNDDKHPDPQEVDKTEEVLKLYEKNYEFHRYDGAGHGFWYYDKAMYRQEQAMDSFNKVIAFFDKYLK